MNKGCDAAWSVGVRHSRERSLRGEERQTVTAGGVVGGEAMGDLRTVSEGLKYYLAPYRSSLRSSA